VNRIDGLIAQLAPNGVRWVPMGLLADLNWGDTNTTKSSYVTEGERYPAYSAGGRDGYLDHFDYDRTAVVLSAIGALAGKTWLATGKWSCIKNTIRFFSRDEAVASTKFLYWVTSTSNFWPRRGSAQPFISKGDADKAPVPLPPIEVQREIVRVLDTFQALEAELEAELEARRRQYAFCWRVLLAPGDGWRSTTLGKIAEVFDGPHATPKKTDSGPWYLSISSLTNGRFDLAESAHIGEDQYDIWIRRVAPRVGDTMFSYETRLGQAAYWDRDEPAALGRRMGLLRPRESEVYPKFLTLVYLGPEFQSLIRAKTVRGATVDRIPIADMTKWPISIPSISEQQRIVGILDKFDALVNDPGIGLTAELTARRKQYAYYRDRLLTFKELAA
jgi:restriction endonuclease S subunit